MAFHKTKKKLKKLAFESLESRRVMATLPFGAEADDTAEFMLGRVLVTPVFLESDGSIDVSSENWTPSHINTVLSNIQTGLNWWTSLLATKSSIHTLDWIVDTTYATTPKSTPYEPINRISNAYTLWVSRFLSDVGFSSSSNLESNIRDFNNSQREKFDTDWSFTIFVVNSVNDGDGSFAPGGSFSRAFAFAGGLFEVVPSTRPASTFAHETGHMFWARDEYVGGGNYFQRRGYYNAQNSNAIDLNPDSNFQQQLSIMSAGGNLQSAYDNLVSPPSTLAQIGWQDSDGDGIFDVLDVPLKLEGTGRFVPGNGTYRFVGKASVQTLPNKNTSGTQHDITLNRIGRIEYRINGGSWLTLLTPNQYQTNIDVSIPLAVTSGQIEIRAIDPRTGITSNIFDGTIGDAPDVTHSTGIQGFVWNDTDGNGAWGSQEVGVAGATVTLVDALGQPLQSQKSIEPDNFPSGMFENTVSGVRIDAIGEDASGVVGVFEDTMPATGSKVFKPYSFAVGNYVDAFRTNAHQLRVRFDVPTNYVSLDAVAVGDNTDVRFEAYAADGSLIQRFERKGMINGQKVSLEVGSSSRNIVTVIARAVDGSVVKLDNLKYGHSPIATTASDGSYVFPYLGSGTYNLKVGMNALGYSFTNPVGGVQTVGLTQGESIDHIDFGALRTPSPWQNPTFHEDVNNQGGADPIDVLILINEINLNGTRNLDNSGLSSPPYYDVNGDRVLSPLDILQVINFINRSSNGGGEGETRFASARLNNASAPLPFFSSFALDVSSNQPTTWITQTTDRKGRLGELGAEKCGCPACTSFAPAGEYSPSIVDIAKANRVDPMSVQDDKESKTGIATPSLDAAWESIEEFL